MTRLRGAVNMIKAGWLPRLFACLSPVLPILDLQFIFLKTRPVFLGSEGYNSIVTLNSPCGKQRNTLKQQHFGKKAGLSWTDVRSVIGKPGELA